MEELKIINDSNMNPKGIRDSGGYLFFFPKIVHYTGQDERYFDELLEQSNLAYDLLNFLKERAATPVEPKVAADA